MATRPIIDTLRELSHGAVLDEASEALALVVQRVLQTGKGGALSLKLKVKPTGRGAVRTVAIEPDIQTKLPEPDREVTIFFPTEDGNLLRNDPKQKSLDLVRPVETSAPPHDPETGEILAHA